jgi:hypothetical protein
MKKRLLVIDRNETISLSRMYNQNIQQSNIVQ